MNAIFRPACRSAFHPPSPRTLLRPASRAGFHLQGRLAAGALAGALIALATATSAQADTQSRHAGRSLAAGEIVIAAVAALLVLGCAAWAIARRRAFEPRWTLSMRHAIAEAGFRASATWAEFVDWLRLGH
jgi:hypothetical protein